MEDKMKVEFSMKMVEGKKGKTEKLFITKTIDRKSEVIRPASKQDTVEFADEWQKFAKVPEKKTRKKRTKKEEVETKGE